MAIVSLGWALLNDIDANNRYGSAEALEKWGTRSEKYKTKIIPWLCKGLEVEQNAAVRGRIIRALGELGNRQFISERSNINNEKLIKRAIRYHPTLEKRLLTALKAGGTEVLKLLMPFLSIPIETVRAFLEAEDDRSLPPGDDPS